MLPRFFLEPIVIMKVTVPDKYTGDVMGDLNKRAAVFWE